MIMLLFEWIEVFREMDVTRSAPSSAAWCTSFVSTVLFKFNLTLRLWFGGTHFLVPCPTNRAGTPIREAMRKPYPISKRH